jgi:hypothetical protein
MARLQGLGQLKNPINSSGSEPATFRLVAVPQATKLPRDRLKRVKQISIQI